MQKKSNLESGKPKVNIYIIQNDEELKKIENDPNWIEIECPWLLFCSILKKRIKQMNDFYRPKLRSMTEEELIEEFKRFCT